MREKGHQDEQHYEFGECEGDLEVDENLPVGHLSLAEKGSDGKQREEG